MRSIHHRSPLTVVLRALPLLLTAACASHAAPVPDSGRGATGKPVAVVCGRGTGQSRAQPIGVRGATVAVDRHSLTVPEGGVGASTTFTITEVASPAIRVELGPSGTRFGTPATLTLSFARCGGVPRGFRDLQILQVDGNDSVIAVLPSTVDPRARTVSAPLQHLSGYLVGGNRTEQ